MYETNYCLYLTWYYISVITDTKYIIHARRKIVRESLVNFGQSWNMWTSWRLFNINNKQDLYRPLVLKFGYFLVYLVGFRVQKKCKLKVSYFQTFRHRLETSVVRIYFYKKYKGGKPNNCPCDG